MSSHSNPCRLLRATPSRKSASTGRAPPAPPAGCGPIAAAVVLAEFGPDMERFGSARRLASWAGVCPGNRESTGKRGGGRTRKGNRYLRRILCEIAHRERAVRPAPEGPDRAPGRRSCRSAVAHKILRIIDAMLRTLADADLLAQALRAFPARGRRPVDHTPASPPHCTGIARCSATHRPRCIRNTAGLSGDRPHCVSSD